MVASTVCPMDDQPAATAHGAGSLPPALLALREAQLALAGEELAGVDSTSLLTDTAALRTLLDQCEGEWLRRVGEAHARGAAEMIGAGTTKAYLRGTLLMSPLEASKAVHTAAALRSTCSATAQALASGTIGLGQAQVITRVIQRLPSALPSSARENGEHLLLQHAQVLNPADLGRAGRHLTHTLDPNGVSRDEHEATERAGITFAATLYGAGIARGDLDAESLALIQSAIEPLSAPLPATNGVIDTRTAARRRLDALLNIVRHYLDCPTATSVDPGTRRTGVHLSVIVSESTLRAQPGASAGHLSWGGVISAQTARRLACDSTFTPILTSASGRILDVGRRTRVVSAALWEALVVRDGGCAFPGCDAPPSRCQAHHVRHWVDGGRTALTNLVLLCDHHHLRVLHDKEHTDRWQVQIDRDTACPVFTPPAWTRRLGIPLPPLWRPPPAD